MRKPLPPKTTDWSDVAAWYDALVGESGSEYHRHVVLPGVLRLLDAQPQQKVLDVACGQGVLCRLLREKQVETTGIDAARDLITAAKQKGEGDYRVGDARDLSKLPEAAYDAAACVLAIQNIHPVRPVFDSVGRCLKPMGRFVVVMMHPAFRGAKESYWGWDETDKVQYRRVDRYLIPRKSPIVAHPGQKESEYTWTFHKPIEAYVKAARQAGLLMDALEEWPSHQNQPGGAEAGGGEPGAERDPDVHGAAVHESAWAEPE